jgi:DNA-directed RNA polymerase specialized sigma24 family protein
MEKASRKGCAVWLSGAHYILHRRTSMQTTSTNGQELLGEYVRNRSEQAFAELTRRHIDLVFAAACRETAGDHAQAQDITQSVFIALARQASGLRRHSALAGWLFTCVRRVAANHRRASQRRQHREQAAFAMVN